MQATRLNPQYTADWARYPMFEERVVSFAGRYLPETVPELLRQEIRQKWFTCPHLVFYVLVEDDDGHPAGHLCGWIQTEWNKPRVFIYQAELDRSALRNPISREVIRLLLEWIKDLNQRLEAERSIPITSVELMTFHDPRILHRHLKSLGLTNLQATRTHMRYTI